MDCTLSELSISKNPLSYQLFHQNLSRGGVISRKPFVLASSGASTVKFLYHLQQWFNTLVKEKFLSMLGNWISPIEWTLVIIQVVRLLLPRVTPEKAYSEIPHRYRQSCYSTPLIHLWLASLCNLLLQIGGAYIGFPRPRILASTAVTDKSGNNCMFPTLTYGGEELHDFGTQQL